jgi:hypothetical protein
MGGIRADLGEGYATLSLQPFIEVGNVSTDSSAVSKSCPTDWYGLKNIELGIRCYVSEIELINKFSHRLDVNEI